MKKKMEKQQIVVLEKLCNKIVDAINETFTKKYYFVEISQSKIGHIYLFVRKKRGGLFEDELCSVFIWFVNEHYFFDFKVIKECSNYHLHYFLISSDKYVSKYF